MEEESDTLVDALTDMERELVVDGDADKEVDGDSDNSSEGDIVIVGVTLRETVLELLAEISSEEDSESVFVLVLLPLAVSSWVNVDDDV
jgi:hypothetical protein